QYLGLAADIGEPFAGLAAAAAAASSTASSAQDTDRLVLNLDIPLADAAAGSLGVSVKSLPLSSGSNGRASSDSGGRGVFVKSVISGGAAYKDGRLRENDQLLSVNGYSLEGVNNTEATATLPQQQQQEQQQQQQKQQPPPLPP
uniref:PDZ domain-containing protein n=1 Tax=Macrostomum lignano TaxID=282301 RepID=A0A1I8J471_9PLAT